MHELNDNDPRLADCACRNLRMTTRVITQYYDKAFHATGLKSTQFALLNNIFSKEDGISVSELADYALMDQTTVTRNVEILRKKGYVNVETENGDLRKKRITVSTAGKEKFAAAKPLWKEAQLKLQEAVGKEQYKTLLAILSELRKFE